MIPEAEIRSYLGDLTIKEASSSLLLSLEQTAISTLEEKTGNYFGPKKSVYITFHGGFDSFWLPFQVKTITKVQYKRFSDVIWTDLDALSYRFTLGNRIQPVTDVWGLWYIWSNNNVQTLRWSDALEYRVEVELGYDVGEEPYLLRQMVLDLIGFLLNRRMMLGFSSVTSESTKMTISKLEDLPLWSEFMTKFDNSSIIGETYVEIVDIA